MAVLPGVAGLARAHEPAVRVVAHAVPAQRAVLLALVHVGLAAGARVPCGGAVAGVVVDGVDAAAPVEAGRGARALVHVRLAVTARVSWRTGAEVGVAAGGHAAAAVVPARAGHAQRVQGHFQLAVCTVVAGRAVAAVVAAAVLHAARAVAARGRRAGVAGVHLAVVARVARRAVALVPVVSRYTSAVSHAGLVVAVVLRRYPQYVLPVDTFVCGQWAVSEHNIPELCSGRVELELRSFVDAAAEHVANQHDGPARL